MTRTIIFRRRRCVKLLFVLFSSLLVHIGVATPYQYLEAALFYVDDAAVAGNSTIGLLLAPQLLLVPQQGYGPDALVRPWAGTDAAAAIAVADSAPAAAPAYAGRFYACAALPGYALVHVPGLPSTATPLPLADAETALVADMALVGVGFVAVDPAAAAAGSTAALMLMHSETLRTDRPVVPAAGSEAFMSLRLPLAPPADVKPGTAAATLAKPWIFLTGDGKFAAVARRQPDGNLATLPLSARQQLLLLLAGPQLLPALEVPPAPSHWLPLSTVPEEIVLFTPSLDASAPMLDIGTADALLWQYRLPDLEPRLAAVTPQSYYRMLNIAGVDDGYIVALQNRLQKWSRDNTLQLQPQAMPSNVLAESDAWIRYEQALFSAAQLCLIRSSSGASRFYDMRTLKMLHEFEQPLRWIAQDPPRQQFFAMTRAGALLHFAPGSTTAQPMANRLPAAVRNQPCLGILLEADLACFANAFYRISTGEKVLELTPGQWRFPGPGEELLRWDAAATPESATVFEVLNPLTLQPILRYHVAQRNVTQAAVRLAPPMAGLLYQAERGLYFVPAERMYAAAAATPAAPAPRVSQVFVATPAADEVFARDQLWSMQLLPRDPARQLTWAVVTAPPGFTLGAAATLSFDPQAAWPGFGGNVKLHVYEADDLLEVLEFNLRPPMLPLGNAARGASAGYLELPR